VDLAAADWGGLSQRFWPLPKTTRFDLRTWVNPVPPINFIPLINYDWQLPRQPNRIEQTWLTAQEAIGTSLAIF
jgi:hypothetical protein